MCLILLAVVFCVAAGRINSFRRKYLGGYWMLAAVATFLSGAIYYAVNYDNLLSFGPGIAASISLFTSVTAISFALYSIGVLRLAWYLRSAK